MSKERDALKKAIGIINFTHPNTWHEFISEVEELLAQPEPTAEPVAWMWDEMFCEDWTTVSSVIKPSKSKYVDNVRPLYLTPPKRESLTPRQGLEEYKKGYARAEIDLKREPLSDEDVFRLYEESEYLGFLAYRKGIKDAEKAHGITGGGECVAT